MQNKLIIGFILILCLCSIGYAANSGILSSFMKSLDSDGLIFYNSTGSNIMYISNPGLIGINEPNPVAQLEIQSDSGYTGQMLRLDSQGTGNGHIGLAVTNNEATFTNNDEGLGFFRVNNPSASGTVLDIQHKGTGYGINIRTNTNYALFTNGSIKAENGIETDSSIKFYTAGIVQEGPDGTCLVWNTSGRYYLGAGSC